MPKYFKDNVALVYICSGSFAPVEGRPLVLEKEVIYSGDFQSKDGDQDIEFSVDELTLDHWRQTTDGFIAAGIEIPIPIEHTQDPEKKRGKVVGSRVGKNEHGLDALFLQCEFLNQEALKLAESSDVSVYVPPEFVDGTGKRWVRPIRHLALTNYPVIPKLGKWKTLAASQVQGTSNMSLQTIAEAVGIPVADQDDPQLEVKIVQMIHELQSKVTELEGDGDPEPDADDTSTVAASFVPMVRKSRTLEIDQLVERGQITPAVAVELKKQFTADSAIALSFSPRGQKFDSFDSTIAALSKNEQVVSFKEKTKGQTVRLSHAAPKAGDEPSGLVKNAQKRAEEAKK